jgi:N-sulfoglucosamine sulfohydrolase
MMRKPGVSFARCRQHGLEARVTIAPSMNARLFLSICLAGAAILLGCTTRTLQAADASAAPDLRPNILLAIADDWSWPHAGAYGDTVVKTPTFDRVAREGVLFSRAFSAASTCSASRASILTGQAPHRLAEGANLWGTLPAKFPVFPDQLEAAGYFVGHMGKGWGPGDLGDRKRNPAGPAFKSFEQFLRAVPAGKPFCFWFGSHDPHRPYRKGQGVESGMRPEDVKVPAFLPDTPEVRGDILDYYFAVQRYDRDTGDILRQIEAAGRLDNTLVVMTGDNGMPFPRAKANTYEFSTHQPLAIRWPARAKGAGRTVDALVSLTDLAPTFLEAAGQKPRPEMTGRSFLAAITGDAFHARDAVFLERERHANVRQGDKSYPIRAIRTDRYLYVRNVRPDLWPAGDPQLWFAVGPFGDIDPGPSKDVVTTRQSEPAIAPFFRLACEKRPEEELYDLEKDPNERHNVADAGEYAQDRSKLRARLDDWMKQTADPRATAGGDYDAFDHYRYFGAPAHKEKRSP